DGQEGDQRLDVRDNHRVPRVRDERPVARIGEVVVGMGDQEHQHEVGDASGQEQATEAERPPPIGITPESVPPSGCLIRCRDGLCSRVHTGHDSAPLRVSTRSTCARIPLGDRPRATSRAEGQGVSRHRRPDRLTNRLSALIRFNHPIDAAFMTSGARPRVLRLLAVLALTASAAGCSSGRPQPSAAPATTTLPPTTAATPTGPAATVPVPTSDIHASAFRVYFLRGDVLAVAGRTVPSTPAVAGAAMTALLGGPTPPE